MRRFSALAGGVALAILMLPIITRTTEELLRLVPDSLREAGARARACPRGGPPCGSCCAPRRPASRPASCSRWRASPARPRRCSSPRSTTASGASGLDEPDRLAARADLHLRDLALRGLAPAGLGRRARARGAWCLLAQRRARGCSRATREDAMTLERRPSPAGRPRGERPAPERPPSRPARRCAPRGLRAWFGTTEALKGITLPDPRPTRSRPSSAPPAAASRPSSAASTACTRSCRARASTGSVLLDGEDIYARGVDPVRVRRRVGMVFQKPNPFPTMSIRDNVLAGLRLNGLRPRDPDGAGREGARGRRRSGTR